MERLLMKVRIFLIQSLHNIFESKKKNYVFILGRGCHPPKVFVTFSLKDKISAPDVFSSCSFIPGAHYETSLMMISCYGDQIERHK